MHLDTYAILGSLCILLATSVGTVWRAYNLSKAHYHANRLTLNVSGKKIEIDLSSVDSSNKAAIDDALKAVRSERDAA